jgi:predicted lipoprotein with Yx(FWY)xxD motif
MNRLALLAVGVGAAAGIAAGCSSGTSSSSSPAQTSGGAAIVKTVGSSAGPVLVDGSGQALYRYTPDTGSSSTCTGTCASTWPPDTTTGKPQADGVNASLLGTTTRPDHTMQVTFDGHPLYRFSGDSGPGQFNGQGSQGIWFVVNTAGANVTKTPVTTTGGSGGGGGGGGGGGY